MRALWNDKTLTAASNVLQPTCQNMVDFKPYEDEVCGSTSKDISHPTDTIEKDLDTLQHHASNELQHDKQDISNQSANASNLTPLPEDVFEEDEENIQNM